jgi:hypothetical protein
LRRNKAIAPWINAREDELLRAISEARISTPAGTMAQ